MSATELPARLVTLWEFQRALASTKGERRVAFRSDGYEDVKGMEVGGEFLHMTPFRPWRGFEVYTLKPRRAEGRRR